ncbi:MAG: PEP-CTERM sorting domain-containing protein [Bryobacterales bacterium]|nr:PEP-CTERM sorting domain-containing protein [Bryobacterales bacterium]
MNRKRNLSALAVRATGGLLLLILAMVPVTRANANLIANGAFTSNADGWTSGNIVSGGFQETIGNPAGSFLLNWFGTATSDPYIQQTIAGLNPGQSYNLSWDLLHHATNATTPSFAAFLDPTDAGTSPNGLTLLLLSYPGPFTSKPWVSHQTSFVATATSHTIRFAAELDTRTPGVTVNTDVSYYIDNVALFAEPNSSSAVPEPSTWALIALGGAALWARRLRGRRRA